jgi:hypothetical protein
MLLTFLSICVALVPFLCVLFFKNRTHGFLLIFTISALLHITTALVTQAFGVFNFFIVSLVHYTFVIVSILFFIYQTRKKADIVSEKDKIFSPKISGETFKKIPYFVIGIAILCVYILYSIHFNYTGIVDTTLGLKKVEKSSYTYPFYSDEWIGASLAQYSIETKKLPLVNPLANNAPFMNFLVGSHSVYAELLVFFNLHPVTQYIYLAMGNGLLLCIFLFIVLRVLQVSPIISSVASLSILLMTNSGNLPGAWFLIPYLTSTIFVLVSIAGFVLKSSFVYRTSVLIALLLYPPMIVFVLPLIIGAYYVSSRDFQQTNDKLFKYLLIPAGAGLILILFLKIGKFDVMSVLTTGYNFIIRPSLDEGKVYFNIWNVLPIFILFLVIIGSINLIRRWRTFVKSHAYIIFPTIVGLFLWIVSVYVEYVFLIELSRVVFVTSIFLIILGSIGIQKISESVYIKKIDPFLLKGMNILFFIFLIFWVALLPRLSLWHKNELLVETQNVHQTQNQMRYIPAPAVTRYLHPDDIRLFQNFTSKRFVAPSWKGLVIGVATKNYPLDSKSSTLTNKFLIHSNFLKANCSEKEELVKQYKIDLIYTIQLSCNDQFEEIGKSAEGFILYAPRKI